LSKNNFGVIGVGHAAAYLNRIVDNWDALNLTRYLPKCVCVYGAGTYLCARDTEGIVQFGECTNINSDKITCPSNMVGVNFDSDSPKKWPPTFFGDGHVRETYTDTCAADKMFNALITSGVDSSMYIQKNTTQYALIDCQVEPTIASIRYHVYNGSRPSPPESNIPSGGGEVHRTEFVVFVFLFFFGFFIVFLLYASRLKLQDVAQHMERQE